MTTAIHTGSGDRTLKSKAIDPSAFTEIPVLDLSAAFSPDLEARKALAKELRYVCQHVGFFMVKGHRVPERVIEAAFKCAHKFFDMTMEEKMALDISKTDNFKGYTPLLGENTDPDNKGDLHESFDFGDDSPKTDVGGISSGNIWPPASQLPGFREAVNEYFGEILKLGKTLFRMFALALELPENFFEDKTTKVGSIGRLLHYPPQIGEIDEKVIGIGAVSLASRASAVLQVADARWPTCSTRTTSASRSWVTFRIVPNLASFVLIFYLFFSNGLGPGTSSSQLCWRMGASTAEGRPLYRQHWFVLCLGYLAISTPESNQLLPAFLYRRLAPKVVE